MLDLGPARVTGLVAAMILTAPTRPFAEPVDTDASAVNVSVVEAGAVEPRAPASPHPDADAGAGVENREGAVPAAPVESPVAVPVVPVAPASPDAAAPRASAPRARPAPAPRIVKPTALVARTPARSDEKAPDAAALAAEVTVHLIVEPHQNARVQWGAKDLGPPPIELKRPRGSGPLDVSVRCPGYLTVHTRLFTDHDDKLVVNLVPVSEAARVLGYRPSDVRPTRKTLP